MINLINDMKYAVRQLWKNPGLAFTVVAILALAIGANTVMFSMVQGILLSPLPYEQPGQIVQIWEDPSGHGDRNSVSGGAFSDWREHNTVFEALTVIQGVSMNLTGDGRPQRVSGCKVSADYLKVFRVRPLLGRGFLPEEEILGNDTKVVMLSNELWHSRFGADPKIVNQSINLDGEPFKVIGVLPPLATRLNGAQFLTPFIAGSEQWHSSRGDHRLLAMGRLKSGLTLTQAATEMRAQRTQIASLYPKWKQDWSVTLVPLHEEVVGPVRPIVILLWGIVGFVLLIACINVANLLLVRAASRQKEMAIRAALGAGSIRVVRQILTESVLLALLGGGLGILFAVWGVQLITRFSGDILPGIQSVGLNVPVLLFSLLVSLGTGLFFGILPAVRLARVNSNISLREGRQNTVSFSRHRFANMLVVSEVSLALVLLIGAGLLLRSFFNLMQVKPGFEPARTLTFELSLPAVKYSTGDDRAVFFHQVFNRLREYPGVEAAGMATTLPMTGYNLDCPVMVEGRADQPEFGYPTQFDFVAGDYFQAMGIPLHRGRDFRERDNSTQAPRVVILNQALANHIFPEQDPLGNQINFWGQIWDVVGIVGDVRHTGLNQQAQKRIYLPQAFSPWNGSIVVRTAGEPVSLIEPVRRAVLAVDPDQPVSNIRTYEQIIMHSLARQNLLLIMLGIFAGVGLVLAVMGLYGVVAYIVSQRRQEIGIRMALGAERSDILKLVVRHGLLMSIGGTVIGIIGSLVLTRLLASQLFNVSSSDPVTYAGVSILLILTAIVACAIPARRAAKIDPMEALRYE